MSRARRADLQGLRALAVLLVAFNHAGVGFLPGGYVGVDVFFVLSGFFISGLLFDEAFAAVARGRSGASISLSRFYGRRARRILPAACLTLIAINVAAYTLLNVVDTTSILHDSIAATFFFANFHFAADATNYFAQATGGMPSPVQHFWSLSLEEQFYFVWPSLLIVTFWIARRFAAWRRRPAGEPTTRSAAHLVWSLILVVLIASLAWSIIDTKRNPSGAYFSTFTRAWELALGAAIAFWAPRLTSTPQRARGALALVGFAMIAVSATVFSSTTSFPGYAALLPTVGSALLIVAGIGALSPGVGRVLSSRPMTFIGDRSYTLYLWHFPVLIIVARVVGHQLPVATNLLLLCGAFALSCVTYALYENPLRHASWMRARRLVLVAGGVLATTTLSAVIPVASIEASIPPSSRPPPMRPPPGHPVPTSFSNPPPIPAVTAAVDAAKRNAPVPRTLAPPIVDAENDNYEPPPGCAARYEYGITSRVCRLGDTASRTTIVIIGDSHAQMWVPALLQASRQLHVAVVPFDHPGCLLRRFVHQTAEFPCSSWYDWAAGQARALNPAITLVAFRWDQFDPHQTGIVVTILKRLLLEVPRGALIGDPPAQREVPAECLAGPGANLGRCTTPQGAKVAPLLRDLAAMATSIDRPVIPTLQWFCGDMLCPMVINHTITRRDPTHLTTTYAKELGPLMAAELRAAIRQASVTPPQPPAGAVS